MEERFAKEKFDSEIQPPPPPSPPPISIQTF
jgi:hypothetical protein